MFRLLARIGLGIDDHHAGPGGQPLQVAALPFLCGGAGGLRFVLVTSRRARRWIIPKGWPVRGLSFAESAAREAFEEAGLRGTILPPLATLARSGAPSLLVHPLRVETLLETWPEARQRRRHLLSRHEAAEAVASEPLADIILAFEDPST